MRWNLLRHCLCLSYGAVIRDLGRLALISPLVPTWKCFRLAEAGRDAIVVRFQWSARQDAIRSSAVLYVRLAHANPRTSFRGFVVAGPDGVECPALPDSRFVIPGPATAAPFYALLQVPELSSASSAFFTQAVLVLDGADGDDACVEIEVSPQDAWSRPPRELDAEVQTLLRLVGTGGDPRERGAYLRASVELLSQVDHPLTASILLSLESDAAIAGLPLDMRPLARPQATVAMAEAAEVADEAAVRAMFTALPPALRGVPALAELVEAARKLESAPDGGRKAILAAARRAYSEGRLERCISICRRLSRGAAGMEAQQLRLEAAADLIEGALRARRLDEARLWLEREGATFEAAVGADDPWLVSVRGAASGIEVIDNIEVADAAEAARGPASGAHAVWSKMRKWLDRGG
jgi:hypothetical protein